MAPAVTVCVTLSQWLLSEPVDSLSTQASLHSPLPPFLLYKEVTRGSCLGL